MRINFPWKSPTTRFVLECVTRTGCGNKTDGDGDGRNSHLFRSMFESHVDTLSADRGGWKQVSPDLPDEVREELEQGKLAIKRCVATSESRTLKTSLKKKKKTQGKKYFFGREVSLYWLEENLSTV